MLEETVTRDLTLELVKAWDRLTFHFELTKIIGRTSELNEMLNSIVKSLAEVLGAGEVILATETDTGKVKILTSGIVFNLPDDLIKTL